MEQDNYKEIILGFEQKIRPIKNTYHNQEYNLDFYVDNKFPPLPLKAVGSYVYDNKILWAIDNDDNYWRSKFSDGVLYRLKEDDFIYKDKEIIRENLRLLKKYDLCHVVFEGKSYEFCVKDDKYPLFPIKHVGAQGNNMWAIDSANNYWRSSFSKKKRLFLITTEDFTNEDRKIVDQYKLLENKSTNTKTWEEEALSNGWGCPENLESNNKELKELLDANKELLNIVLEYDKNDALIRQTISSFDRFGIAIDVTHFSTSDLLTEFLLQLNNKINILIEKYSFIIGRNSKLENHNKPQQKDIPIIDVGEEL